MKAIELRKKDKKELEKSVLDLQKRLNDIRFRLSANQLKNIKEVSNIKKDIARILTVLRQDYK